MKQFSLLGLVFAFGMATASMLGTDHHNRLPSSDGNVAQNADGAFRDGFYLGGLAAQSGTEPHIATGRWGTLEDRSSFTVGYQRGYSEFLASRAAPTTLGRTE